MHLPPIKEVNEETANSSIFEKAADLFYPVFQERGHVGKGDFFDYQKSWIQSENGDGENQESSSRLYKEFIACKQETKCDRVRVDHFVARIVDFVRKLHNKISSAISFT
jgi:hypothetical protein